MVGAERLCLGTVQWGMPYGIANRQGQPGPDEVRAILALARGAGIRTLDTARGYGEAERVLGELVGADESFEIVTKLTPDLGDGDRVQVVARALASVETSRRLLRRDKLDTLLLHRPAHRLLHGGAVWDALLELRARGVVDHLGVSVVEAEEAPALLADPSIEVMQVPASLLDQRLARAGFFDRARAANRRVFVRSVYLQGIAFLRQEELDPFFAPLLPVLSSLDAACQAAGVPRPRAFLDYARLLPAQLVLGIEHASQLRAALDQLSVAPVDLAGLAGLVPALPVEQLNPACWQLRARAGS